MGMGADNPMNIAARTIGMGGGLPKALDVVGIRWAGVNRNKSSQRIPHQIAIGSWACHKTGVGSGQAQHVSQKRNRFKRLPVGGRGKGA